MKKRVVVIVGSVLMISLLCFQTTSHAQNMLRKLGRGVSNILTGPFEIPISVQEKLYDEGPVAAASYGVIDGCWKSAVRMVVGVYEVISFPFPVPAEYAPIVEPEFLFSPDSSGIGVIP